MQEEQDVQQQLAAASAVKNGACSTAMLAAVLQTAGSEAASFPEGECLPGAHPAHYFSINYSDFSPSFACTEALSRCLPCPALTPNKQP